MQRVAVMGYAPVPERRPTIRRWNSRFSGGRESFWGRLLFEFPVLWMGAEIAVAEKEGVVATVAFLLGKAIGELRADVLGKATFPLLLVDLRLMQHVSPPGRDVLVLTPAPHDCREPDALLYSSNENCKVLVLFFLPAGQLVDSLLWQGEPRLHWPGALAGNLHRCLHLPTRVLKLYNLLGRQF